jgi:four helix bundle protein
MSHSVRSTQFGHDRLAVYAAALEFLQLVENLLEAPGTRRHLLDQLDRAGTSIVLNIAEGAGEFSPPEKARFYRMARRSATECAAVLDIFQIRGHSNTESLLNGRQKLWEIVAMLTSMINRSRDTAVQEEASSYGLDEQEGSALLQQGEGEGEGEGEGLYD